jgi:FkbM family methyltransferase
MTQRFVLKPSGLRFACDTDIEIERVKTFMTKEVGTIAWLKRLGPGDVLYDVGANIGLYAIFGASRGAQVYAFEPHAGNAASLLRNASLNPTAPVTLVTDALDEDEGYGEFNYWSHKAGTSRHQLNNTTLEDGDEFTPVARERKHAVPMDVLVRCWGFTPPTHVKIDVDGNEMRVLRGMEDSLKTVRSLQVEVHPTTQDEVDAYFAARGFHLVERHYTSNGKAALRQGVPKTMIPHNAVYEPLP